MQLVMLPNECEPGWAARLQKAGIRVSYRILAFGGTRWLLKKGNDFIEVQQAKNRRKTNPLPVLSAVQRELVDALVATGIAHAN